MPNQYIPKQLGAEPPSDVLQPIETTHPDIAADLRAVTMLHRHTDDRNLEDPAEAVPFDVSVLADYTYEGKHLTEEQTTFVLQFLMEGFPRSTNRFPNYKEFPPIVLGAIQEITKLARKQIQVNPHKVIRTLGNILDANISDVLDVTNGTITLKDFAKLPRAVTAGVKSIHEIRGMQGTQIRVEMHNPLEAAQALARIMGMQKPQKLEIDVSEDLTKRLNAALERANRETVIEGVLERDE